MSLEEERALYDAALAAAKSQAGRDADREGVGAAAMTAEGTLLTGVWIEAMCDSACLCAETGPICEAHRIGERLVSSICVRWTEGSGSAVLAACGVCQERLATFGVDMAIAVADSSPRGYKFVPLTDLRPSAWWDAIDAATSAPG